MRHYTLIKGNIHQEGITVLNIYAVRTAKFIKETLVQLKPHIEPCTATMGDF